MIRGMISGLIWGAVFSAGLGVVITQVGGRIDVVRAAVPPVAVDAAGGTAPVVDATTGASGSALGTPPPIGAAPQPGQQPLAETPVDGSADVARPATLAVESAADAVPPDTETAVAPSEGSAPDRPRNPQAGLPQTGTDGLPARVPDAPVAGDAEAVAVPETPAAPTGQGDAPDAPQSAAGGIDAVPAAPGAPTAEGSAAADATVAGTNPPSAPGTIVSPGGPTAPGDPDNAVAAAPGSDARPATPRPSAPTAVARDDLGDDVLAALAPDDVPQPDAPGIDQSDEQVASSGGPQTEAARSAARVVVNRLPRIGDPLPGEEAVAEDATAEGAAAEDAATEDAGQQAEEPATGQADGETEEGSDPELAQEQGEAATDEPQGTGALYTNSVPFERGEDEPVLAVVLIDDPNSSADLSALPSTVTIAIQSNSVGSVQRAQAHRDAGREVVLIPPISGGDSRTDIARKLADAVDNIPEAVAVMDLPAQPFQSSRFAVGEVVVGLAATGHGMIIYPGGLNSAERLGEQQGLATARVYRQIDSGDQGAPEVKLLLDQAAFQARQSDAVILIGRNRPDTVQALAEWVDRPLDDGVKLAPVSVALKP